MYDEAKDYLRRMLTEKVETYYYSIPKPRLSKCQITASTFTYLGDDGKFNHEWCSNSACHASVYNYGKPTLVCMVDSIQHLHGEDDKIIDHDDKRAWLKYFMDHPIFGKTFLEHDPDVALEEGMTVRDIGSLPANVCMFALIAIRALWENFQYRLPRRFRTLLELGLTPDVAFILSWYIDKDLTLSTIMNSGHSCISTAHMSNEWVKNYLTHSPVSVAPGTLKDKVYQTGNSGNNKWSVFGIFNKASNNVYCGINNTKRFELTVKKFFDGEVTKEKLLAFEKELLHA